MGRVNRARASSGASWCPLGLEQVLTLLWETWALALPMKSAVSGFRVTVLLNQGCVDVTGLRPHLVGG